MNTEVAALDLAEMSQCCAWCQMFTTQIQTMKTLDEVWKFIRFPLECAANNDERHWQQRCMEISWSIANQMSVV
jgi:hypothetical protein